MNGACDGHDGLKQIAMICNAHMDVGSGQAHGDPVAIASAAATTHATGEREQSWLTPADTRPGPS